MKKRKLMIRIMAFAFVLVSLARIVLADGPGVESGTPLNGSGAASDYTFEAVGSGGILMIILAIASILLLFRQQPWNKRKSDT